MFGRGELGKSLVIHQILPSKLMMCNIKEANKQEFAILFLSQTFTLSSTWYNKYHTEEIFGGGKFWRTIQVKAIGEEKFSE